MRSILAAHVTLLSLVAACGGKTKVEPPEPAAVCPEPASAAPDAGSVAFQEGAPYEMTEVTLRNQCAQTIWPAWTRTGGLDQTVIDPGLWVALAPGESRDVPIRDIAVLEIAFWGRTRCSFDAGGRGACETGDCGAFVCEVVVNDTPTDATVFRLDTGFGPSFNVPMRVTSPVCEARECRFDLGACSGASRIAGACGIAACRDGCPSGSGHESGCSTGPFVVTFCG